MIKELKVKGLNERLDLDYQFNPDLNLLTGKNGAGKTTVLKLIWYLNAGNYLALINEINFEEAILITESGKISIKREIVGKRDKTINYKISQNDKDVTINLDELRHLDFRHPRYVRSLNEFREMSFPSLFFPTFRRIEGGFLVDNAGCEKSPCHFIEIKILPHAAILKAVQSLLPVPDFGATILGCLKM